MSPSSTYPRLAAFDGPSVAAILQMTPGEWDASAISSWRSLIGRLADDRNLQPRLTRCLTLALELSGLLRWACLATRLEEVLRDLPASQALICAERWLRNPDESTRYEAARLAELEDYDTGGALAAQAVFSSGASLAPLGEPPQPPGRNLARKAAAGALSAIAAALGGQGFWLINRIGLEIAAGGDGRRGAQLALDAAAGAQP